MSVILRPVITEKSFMLTSGNKYTFVVDKKTSSIEVGRAIALQYGVTVLNVAVVTVHGKKRSFRRTAGQTRGYKKAIVTIKLGEKIPGFELEAAEPESAAKEEKARK